MLPDCRHPLLCFHRQHQSPYPLHPCCPFGVGDDIDADVGGGQQAGLKGILTKTGKYRQAYAAASSVKPDYVIDSIKDLPGILDM